LKARISPSLALVLVHDLLCSKQGIAAANGPIKDAILRHKTRLKADYVRKQLSQKDKAEGKAITVLPHESVCSSMGAYKLAQNDIR
jgi:hypothetical protein